MKLLLLLGLATIATVHAAPWLADVNERDWMIIPGYDGKAHLAMLNYPAFQPRLTDPYTQVTFYLYTRSNRNSARQIWVNNINGDLFQASQPTKFVIHGFTGSATDDWALSIKNKFLDKENCNVVIVDWSGPAQGPLYNVAQANAQPTGEYVGEMHNFFGSLGHGVSNSHCIGHSLGAHVCGFSGKSSSGNLGRVTGMDPALPLFSYDNSAGRLDKGDASYVDVIHSCAGWLGFERPLGHADFYPNGGSFTQPGCGSDVTGACSHGRSHEFFLESISSNNFVGRQCADWDSFQNGACNGNPTAIMGDPSSTGSRGTFYLATSGSSPFALG